MHDSDSQNYRRIFFLKQKIYTTTKTFNYTPQLYILPLILSHHNCHNLQSAKPISQVTYVCIYHARVNYEVEKQRHSKYTQDSSFISKEKKKSCLMWDSNPRHSAVYRYHFKSSTLRQTLTKLCHCQNENHYVQTFGELRMRSTAISMRLLVVSCCTLRSV